MEGQGEGTTVGSTLTNHVEESQDIPVKGSAVAAAAAAPEDNDRPGDGQCAQDDAADSTTNKPAPGQAQDGQETQPTQPASGETEGNASSGDANTDNVPDTNSGEAPGETPAEPRQEADCEDDFSEMSEKSIRNATAATAAAPADGSEQSPVPANMSPTPSAAEEPRAEAGVVVPMPNPIRVSDGRSAVEERGEIRGEDRSEMLAEGGEDSRGLGQWKSEEELFLQTTLTNQQAEREALQAALDKKAKVQKEYDELKGRYLALEEGSKQGHMESGVLKERCQQQEAQIKKMEQEEARLREFEQWGKDNEAKVRDLQDRLATLAGEDAEKDRQIQRLRDELQETRMRLSSTERLLAFNNEAAAGPPTPQSKTCTLL